jgi:hypothetical protein
MKATGFVRRLDYLGRVVIPMRIIRSFDLNEEDSFELVSKDDDTIHIVISACLDDANIKVKFDELHRLTVPKGMRHQVGLETGSCLEFFTECDRIILKPYIIRNIKIGSCYRHFKGKCYKVLNIAKDSENLTEMVVYQALYGNYEVWVRSVDVFLSTVEFEGKLVNRFEKEVEI